MTHAFRSGIAFCFTHTDNFDTRMACGQLTLFLSLPGRSGFFKQALPGCQDFPVSLGR